MADIYPPLQDQEPHINEAAENHTAAKRNRRPSVRLGEIGDQPAATLFHDPHRRPKQWRLPDGKSSKRRQLAKLSDGSYYHREETLDFQGDDIRGSSLDDLAIGRWNKPRRNVPNWLPKIEEGEGFEYGGLRNSSMDGSPADSQDNLGVGQNGRWRDEIELAGESEIDRNGSKDRVKNWLNGLRLGRYWPVFEIHEVDEEVLPFLTLEDLKEMGINAVGSRRKMLRAIEKLGKGFS